MRQTSISSLPLPAGVIGSYAVEARPRDDGGSSLLPVSFDQQRHVAVGPRGGSWMGAAFRPELPVTREAVATAWDRVIARHGTLRTVFTAGPAGEVLLHEADVGRGTWTDHRPLHPGETPAGVVQRVLDAACSPFERPSYRILLVGDEPGEQVVVFGLDHAHVDTWSMVVLLRDLQVCLGDIWDGRDPGAGLPDASAFVDHTRALAARPPAPEEIRARWAGILERSGGVMPRFPLPLGDVAEPRPDVVDVIDILDADEVLAYADAAGAQGVRMLPLTVSVMTQVTRRLSGQPLRAVMPVHSRTEPRWQDSVGWFITNSVLEAEDPDPRACTDAVRAAVSLGSYPLAPLMEPYGGMPVAPGMFAVSWLDNRRLPITLPGGDMPWQVSSRALTSGVMVWFLLNGDGMHARVRYPDTAQARGSVDAWLGALRDGIRRQVG